MKSSLKYLNDEHMRLYEWSGLNTQTTSPHPARSKRSHPWHASCSVLGVLTSLLILNGCNKQGAAEQTSKPVEQAAQEMKAAPQVDYASVKPTPAEAAAPAAEQPVQPGDQPKP